MKCRCGHTKHEHVCPAPGRCCSGGHLAPHKVPRIEAVCHGTQECKCKQFDPEGEMKWKVGQVYKSRDLKDYRVLAIDAPIEGQIKYPVITMDMRTGATRNHKEDGRIVSWQDSPSDLMPRVTKVEGWIIMFGGSTGPADIRHCGYSVGSAFFATKETAQIAANSFKANATSIIPVSFEVPED